MKFDDCPAFIGFEEVKVNALTELFMPNQPLSVLNDLKFPPCPICKITELISEVSPTLLVNFNVVVISLFVEVTVTRLVAACASVKNNEVKELDTSKIKRRIALLDLYIITKQNLSPN